MMFAIPTPDMFDTQEHYSLDSLENVMQGAAWLDKVAPGWERQIDLSTLNITDLTVCVCAQLFTSYYNGVRRGGFVAIMTAAEVTNHEDIWLNNHGFTSKEDTENWIALIKNRVDTGTLSDV